MNYLNTECHVGGENTHCRGPNNNQLQLHSVVSGGAFLSRLFDLDDLVRRNAIDEWAPTHRPISARANLLREKGHNVSICELEVSLHVPSQNVHFYKPKVFSKDEVIIVPARSVLSKLRG